MKDKSSEIEELGELFVNIDLNDNNTSCDEGLSEAKCSNLVFNGVVKEEPGSNEDNICLDGLKSLKTPPEIKQEVISSEDENNDVCFDGLKSLKTSPKAKQEISSEDENPEQDSGQEVLRKRGQLKKNKTVNHSSTPYKGKRVIAKRLERVPVCPAGFSGGDVCFPCDTGAAPANVPEVLEALIPDLSQLLGDKFMGNLGTPSNVDHFSLDGNEISEDTVKEFLNVNETLPDLGITDDFLEMLDPHMLDCPKSVSSGSEIIDSSLEDQFISNSPDNGYVSASPDNRYPESPASFFASTSDISIGLLCASPPSPALACESQSSSSNAASPSQPVKKKRNPFLEGFPEKLCEKYHRAILKKAREGVGLNQKDNKNGTLLHLAIEQKNEAYAIVMLNMLQKNFQNGPNKKILSNFSDLPSFLNQEDDYGRTPLLLACIFNLPKVLEYLLVCGASPALKEKFSYGSVFHYVCERGSRFYQITEILCNNASGFLNMTNSRKESPLHIAVGYHGITHDDASTGTREVVDNNSLISLLLSKKATLSAQDELGRTPLHWMIISKNLHFLENFYSWGCDWRQAVNLQNIDGRTILHGAAQMVDLPVEKQRSFVEQLVVYYASPQVQDSLGKYPRDLVPDNRKAYLSILNGHLCESRGWQEDLM